MVPTLANWQAWLKLCAGCCSKTAGYCFAGNLRSLPSEDMSCTVSLCFGHGADASCYNRVADYFNNDFNDYFNIDYAAIKHMGMILPMLYKHVIPAML